jgi:hypothetical protein
VAVDGRAKDMIKAQSVGASRNSQPNNEDRMLVDKMPIEIQQVPTNLNRKQMKGQGCVTIVVRILQRTKIRCQDWKGIGQEFTGR